MRPLSAGDSLVDTATSFGKASGNETHYRWMEELAMSDKKGEAQVRTALAGIREELRDLPAGEDLISSRAIDSLTFITFVQNLIDISGREPDLEAVPIDSLRTIRGLAEIFFGSDVYAGQVSE